MLMLPAPRPMLMLPAVCNTTCTCQTDTLLFFTSKGYVCRACRERSLIESIQWAEARLEAGIEPRNSRGQVDLWSGMLRQLPFEKGKKPPSAWEVEQAGRAATRQRRYYLHGR